MRTSTKAVIAFAALAFVGAFFWSFFGRLRYQDDWHGIDVRWKYLWAAVTFVTVFLLRWRERRAVRTTARLGTL